MFDKIKERIPKIVTRGGYAKLTEQLTTAQDVRRAYERIYTWLSAQGTRDLASADRTEQTENAYHAWRTSPMAAAFANTVNCLLTRPGFRIAHDDDDAQDEIDEFMVEDKFMLTFKEMVYREIFCGEVYPVAYANTLTGDMKVREYDPEEIKEVIVSDDDYKVIEGLYRKYIQRTWDDASNSYKTKNEEETIRKDEPVPGRAFTVRTFFQFKRPVLSNTMRGISYLAPVLWDLTQYKEIKRARAVLHRARAAIAFFLTIKGATPEEIDHWQTRINEEWGAPNPGSVMVKNDNMTWDILAPNLDAGDAQHDLRELGLQVGAGVSMPELIVRGDPSNANYSSNSMAVEMFKIYFSGYFGLWTIHLTELFDWFLERKYKAARISQEAANTPVEVIWPDLPVDAEQFQKMLDNALGQGTISKDTYVNYLPIPVTYEDERDKIADERDEDMVAAGSLAVKHPEEPEQIDVPTGE